MFEIVLSFLDLQQILRYSVFHCSCFIAHCQGSTFSKKRRKVNKLRLRDVHTEAACVALLSIFLFFYFFFMPAMRAQHLLKVLNGNIIIQC